MSATANLTVPPSSTILLVGVTAGYPPRGEIVRMEPDRAVRCP